MAFSHRIPSASNAAVHSVGRQRRTGVAAFAPWLATTAAALVATAATVHAAPLTLAEAERVALCDEPGTLALREQAAAFDDLAVAAGALPDMQIRIGAANLPLEGGGFRAEGMTQAQVGVRQTIPSTTSRVAATRRERARADERRAQVRERRRSVLLAVRNAWLDRFEASRSRALVLDSQALFADLVATTRSLYTVGDKSQQDLLRAELEHSHLEVRRIGVEQQNAQAGAALRRWIGADADRPVAALSAWRPPPAVAELRAGLADHPVLAVAAAATASADAALALARARYRPNWTLDAAYGYRDGALPDGAPRSDLLSVSATLSVPMFTANRQDRTVRAAQGRRRAALALRDDARRRLRADLRREHDRWVDLGRRLALYRDAVLARSRANADAALTAYRSETADFADVMRGYIDDLETRLAHLRLRVDRRRSHAQLAYLGGFALLDAPNANREGGCGSP